MSWHETAAGDAAQTEVGSGSTSARPASGPVLSGTPSAADRSDPRAGAHGSARHAAGLAPGTVVINLDGAAALHQAAAVEAAGDADRLLAALDQAGRDTGIPLRGQAMPSDNRRYAAAGHPAVGIGMGMPGYQTPAETPDRVEPATLLAAARLITATVRHLAAAGAVRT